MKEYILQIAWRMWSVYISIFWITTPRNLVSEYQKFEESIYITFCLYPEDSAILLSDTLVPSYQTKRCHNAGSHVEFS
jgi:hypothetical protein